jgi:hypothetical protein
MEVAVCVIWAVGFVVHNLDCFLVIKFYDVYVQPVEYTYKYEFMQSQRGMWYTGSVKRNKDLVNIIKRVKTIYRWRSKYGKAVLCV